jgi:hypothetical protein
VSSASSFFRRFFRVFIGYMAAVVVAVFVALIAMFLPDALPDMGLWASLPGRLGQMANAVFAGVMITFPFALPGFLVALAVSLVLRWRGWLPFTLAGGLNAPVSLVLCTLFTVAGEHRLDMPDPDMTLRCFVGGLAGGFAYWRVAVRREAWVAAAA